MKKPIGYWFGVQALLMELGKEKMPIKAAYWVARLLDEVSEVLKPADTKRQELFNEYGTEKDGKIEISNEKVPAFLEQLNPLLEEEVEVTFVPIQLSKFGDAQLDVGKVAALYEFIEDDTKD